MASLETLRSKGGWILVAFIAIALLAFLVQDIFTSGNSIFASRQMRVGSIAGTHVDYTEFLNESNYMTDISRMMYGRDAVTSQEQEMIYNMTWDRLIMKHSFAPGFEALGVMVTDAEQVDMVNGEYTSPILTQMFTNPQTGMYNSADKDAFLARVNGNDGTYDVWNFMKGQMHDNRAMTKFSNLVKGGFYANNLEVAAGVRHSNESYAARVAGKEYFSVADSLVNVSEGDIRSYYNSHKESFRQVEGRDIEYVVFDIMPSEFDYEEASENFNEIAKEFGASGDPMQYATLNSQVRPDERYYRADQLAPALAGLATGAIGAMEGPTLNGDTYTVSRLADRRMMPDSLGARHILLAAGDTALADSLMTELRRDRTMFPIVALQYSQDRSAMNNSGDLGRFSPYDMVPEFRDAALGARVGDLYTVESSFGLHIVDLTYRGPEVQKSQIATITYLVEPSATTMQKAYQDASNFVAASGNTLEGFQLAVTADTLSKRTVRIRNTDRTISGLENSKELVRWAFNNDKGSVSPIMEVDDDYLVAALTQVREAGYSPVDQVTPQIRTTLVNKEKARIIAGQMTGATLDEVAANSGAEIDEVSGVQHSMFYIPNVGNEPRLVGAMSAVPVGELSKPVEGTTGVYVFSVTDVTNSETATAESEKVRLEATATNFVGEMTNQALIEESDITDMRVKFF